MKTPVYLPNKNFKFFIYYLIQINTVESNQAAPTTKQFVIQNK